MAIACRLERRQLERLIGVFSNLQFHRPRAACARRQLPNGRGLSSNGLPAADFLLEITDESSCV